MTDDTRPGEPTAGLSRPGDTLGDEGTVSAVVPSIERETVESTGRVGAVAYPYRIVEATVRIPRPLLSDREDRYVLSVDRARRLALRADEVPDVECRTLRDALVVDPELDDAETTEKARETAFEWTLRKYLSAEPPTVTIESAVDAHKLFWLAERPDGDVIVDSVRGTERPLDG
ncbi:hypothetical protein [Halorhabdus amylolytica]|uniref:hypothetical protein n=1 Tax=Halorhabdus amylolytica TaxID=2559573 RepID=UPI0020BE424F|nr:hypothetical protein [Halorhabdus amylolytica]